NALVPQTFWERHVHPDDRERLMEKINRIISDGPGEKWEEEYRFERFNGEYAYVRDRGHIIYEGNKATRIIGATQDITGRKMAEINLLDSEQKLSLIAKQTMNPVIITDADGKITWVNSAFTSITEYEKEEVIGKKPGSFLQGKETSKSTVDYLRKQVEDKQSFDCNIVNYSKTGSKRWMHVQGQPLLDEDGNCKSFFAIETDITEKILLEKKMVKENLRRQKDITDAVLTAQENERDNIGKELHDNLNQILVATKLYIEMAKTDIPDRMHYLDKASGYIVNVIEEIRHISKTLASPDLDILGLFDSITLLLDDLGRVHPVEIEFETHGVDQEELDKKLQINIFRIVQEQLNNILKHSHATLASIHLNRIENDICLHISDNGVGFDTSQRSSGVGIRNIISRAELCHGHAKIKSKPGEGFKLSVALPIGPPDNVVV
ncbi:MAG: PAS domain S-box protein, partial [Ferruginibacter sp.]